MSASGAHARDPRVTVVVVPRDHFSHAAEALESLLENTRIPYRLVYVDGASPPALRDHLRQRARERGFTLLRTEHYLTPNRARNLGLAEARSEYVVFLDNDVFVAPGWLEAAVRCADETGAAVVSPLNCEMLPLHQTIHFAGGEAAVREDRCGGRVERHIVDEILLQGTPVADVRLERTPTGCAEFHGMLVRRSIFEVIGPLDEAMLSTRENLDFCMLVKQAGGTIWLEPDSRITYLTLPLAWSDVPYFTLRWSDAWDRASFDHFRRKWDLALDAYFERQYRILGWRRRLLLEAFVLRRLPSTRLRGWLAQLVFPLERRLNAWWVRHCERRGAAPA